MFDASTIRNLRHSRKGWVLAKWKPASDIGSRLAELRQALAMDQASFAKLAGVTYQTVSDWENEHSKPPRARLRSLAENVGAGMNIFEEGGPRPRNVVIRPGKLPFSGGGAGVVNEPRVDSYSVLNAIRADAERVAQRQSGEIMRHMESRTTFTRGEVLDYLAAMVDAAAGRPATLPPAPETPAAVSPPGRHGKA